MLSKFRKSLLRFALTSSRTQDKWTSYRATQLTEVGKSGEYNTNCISWQFEKETLEGTLADPERLFPVARAFKVSPFPQYLLTIVSRTVLNSNSKINFTDKVKNY